MATAYTSLLGLALPVQGELQGTWGDTVNNSITSLLDTAVAGTTTLSTDADVTLSTTTGAANQARQAIILWTANGTVTRNITAPAQSKIYTVINKTAGTQSIVLRGVGPTTGVTIPAGSSGTFAWNGTDFVDVSNYVNGNKIINGNLTVKGNTTLGDAAGDTLTINGTAVSTPNNLNFDSNTLFIDATNNRVGIGTNTPTVTLQVVSADYPAVSVRNTTAGSSAYSSIQLTQADTTASGYMILGGNTAANTGLRNTVAFGAFTASEVALVTNDYPKFKINANTSAILANSMSPSAWTSGAATLELATGTNGKSLALYSNGSGALYINNLYNDGTNWLYSKNSDFGAIYVQNDNNVGAHAWYTVAQGGAAAAGTTATLVKQATLGQNGVLTLGDTTYAWQSGIGGIDLRNSGALSSDASYSYLSNNIYYDGANNRRKVLGSVGLFGVGNGASALFMHFQVAGSGAAGSTISSLSTAFAVDTSSRFGINTTSMGAPLSFADAAGDKIQFNGNNANQYKIGLATGGTGDAILRYTAGATGAGDHQFYTASSLRFHVTAAGRIAAGAVTTPRYPWSLGGSSGSGISGAIVAVYDNGGATGSGGTNVSNGIGIDMSGNSFELSLYQGNTTGSGGNVTMGQLNTVSGAYTRYAMFNANGMGLATENPSSGVGIKFPASQSASSNANTLDDYEEGSWTPVLSGSLGGSYTMGGVNAGKYIKIGKMVYATATLEWTARTTAYSGNLIVTGLPFANGGIRTCGSMGAVSYGLTFNTGYGEWVYLCDPGRSDVYIIENSTTGSGYSHTPVVGTTGLVYALTVCYEA